MATIDLRSEALELVLPGRAARTIPLRWPTSRAGRDYVFRCYLDPVVNIAAEVSETEPTDVLVPLSTAQIDAFGTSCFFGLIETTGSLDQEVIPGSLSVSDRGRSPGSAEATHVILEDGVMVSVLLAGEPGAVGSGEGGGGAPVDAGYLVTVAHDDLTGEVPVGATPGGELGGTWASFTVDPSHSGSTHAATQAAAEATAATALTTHAAAEVIARDVAIALAVANLIDSSPGALDTLNELAAALGDDPNFAATMTTALAGKQPLDSDLTAIGALTTTAYGRSLLEAANAGALRTLAGAVIGTDVQAFDSDLSAIATLSTTAFGRALLTLADAAALRTAAGLVIGTDVQAQDAELSAIAGLTSAANTLPYFTGSGAAAVASLTAFARSFLDDADAATARTTLGISAGVLSTEHGSTGSTETIVFTASAVHLHRMTLDANCTFTFSATSSVPAIVEMDLVQDVTGSRLATWPASVRWPNDLAPTLTATGGRRDRLRFVTIDGVTFDGALIAVNLAP